MADLLDLTQHLPEIELAAGEELLHEDTRTGSIWVLVSGSLHVIKDGVPINRISNPGAVFGEVAALMDSDHSATVVAASDARLRYARDGKEFLLGSPEVLLLVARGLASRLDLVTRYLADLRNQYAGTPGLEMVSQVLGRLVERHGPPLQPGSARDPDPEY